MQYRIDEEDPKRTGDVATTQGVCANRVRRSDPTVTGNESQDFGVLATAVVR